VAKGTEGSSSGDRRKAEQKKNAAKDTPVKKGDGNTNQKKDIHEDE
jgi:hypothetical protein